MGVVLALVDGDEHLGFLLGVVVEGARNAVVVNLKRVTPEQAKRIVDFLSGTLYAIGGDLQKLGGGIFLCTPNNVNVEGTISEDNMNNKQNTRGKKDAKEDGEDDFF